METTLHKSPLHDRHVQAAANLVPFAGLEMPLEYEGIRQEHEAARGSVGIFDVSHMGEIETSGPEARRFLQRILSNDVAKIAERGALAWFRRHAKPFDVKIEDHLLDWGMIAVQGPAARDTLATIAAGEQPARFRELEVDVAGVGCLVSGTGYTGEDGCELLVPAAGAGVVWDALLEASAVPAGLGARDTLRLEVCFHLYGNDLSEDRNPIGAGLGRCCALDTNFIGSGALSDRTLTQMLVPFAFTDRGIPRPGNEIRAPSGTAVVTSGTLSPSLGIGVGMGYVPIDQAEPGTEIEVDVRGQIRQAEVRKKPLYAKEREA